MAWFGWEFASVGVIAATVYLISWLWWEVWTLRGSLWAGTTLFSLLPRASLFGDVGYGWPGWDTLGRMGALLRATLIVGAFVVVSPVNGCWCCIGICLSISSAQDKNGLNWLVDTIQVRINCCFSGQGRSTAEVIIGTRSPLVYWWLHWIARFHCPVGSFDTSWLD